MGDKLDRWRCARLAYARSTLIAWLNFNFLSACIEQENITCIYLYHYIKCLPFSDKYCFVFVIHGMQRKIEQHLYWFVSLNRRHSLLTNNDSPDGRNKQTVTCFKFNCFNKLCKQFFFLLFDFLFSTIRNTTLSFFFF